MLTFARVFTNHTTTLAYERIFKALFDLIRNITGDGPIIQHIHGQGWGCIVADLDVAQARGLGNVLAELDNSKNWEEHLLHILKSCKVHYKRQVFI